MDRIEEQLEESLAYMREQFKPLTRSIPIPPALHADLLRERLDALVQERETVPAQPEGKLVRFPWKPMMSVAACLVIAVGSYSVYESGKKGMPELMMSSAAASISADAPMSAAAGVAEAADETGQPVADLPMDAVAFAAPTPENMTGGEPVADLPMDAAAFAAPVPESAEVDEASPKLRSIIDAGEADRAVACPRGAESIEQYETLEQARNTPLGGYLPADAPQNTQMTNAFLDATYLSCFMEGVDPATGAVRELMVTVGTMTPEQQAYVVDPAQPNTYDLRLYSMPWADSIPPEQMWMTNDVVFHAADLTPALIEARITRLEVDQGNVPKTRGNFSVLHENQTLVSYRFINLSAQEVMNLVTKP